VCVCLWQKGSLHVSVYISVFVCVCVWQKGSLHVSVYISVCLATALSWPISGHSPLKHSWIFDVTLWFLYCCISTPPLLGHTHTHTHTHTHRLTLTRFVTTTFSSDTLSFGPSHYSYRSILQTDQNSLIRGFGVTGVCVSACSVCVCALWNDILYDLLVPAHLAPSSIGKRPKQPFLLMKLILLNSLLQQANRLMPLLTDPYQACEFDQYLFILFNKRVNDGEQQVRVGGVKRNGGEKPEADSC